MKKIIKRLDASKALIIALVVIIVFSMAACINENDGANTTLPKNYGKKMGLSGDVYIETWTDEKTGFEFDDDVSYIPFYGDLTFENTNGGSGKVIGGKLNYSIGEPTRKEPLDFVSLFKTKDYGFFTSGEAEGVVLRSLPTTSGDHPDLYRGNTTIKIINDVISITEESVIYVYVDKDVTVSGDGNKKDITYTEIKNGITYNTKERVEDLNLKLETGWNTVYEKTEWQIRKTMGTDEVLVSVSITETYEMSLDNPDLKWYSPTTP